MNLGIFEMFEKKVIFSNFLSNGIEVATSRFMKLRELRKIYWRWMHTLEWTYTRQQFSFLGEASSKILRRKYHIEKFKISRRTHPLTKLNENKSFYVKYIWLW
jgi:hypothetical protein